MSPRGRGRGRLRDELVVVVVDVLEFDQGGVVWYLDHHLV